MLILDQVTEVANKLPEARDDLLKKIPESTWENESQKHLASNIVSYVNTYDLHAYGNYVFMSKIEFSVRYENLSLKNGDILEMEKYIKDTCKKINAISPILQFSLAGLSPISKKEISIKINSRF